jgi:hypothetical protein
VTVSAIRLFPMVVSVLPLVKTPRTKRRHLVLVTHFIAVTLWVECYRLLPKVPRERRLAFTHGLGCGLVIVCLVATTLGYGLAANLPPLFAAAILLLTPLAFLLSTAQLQAGIRRAGAGAGACAVSADLDAAHRGRYPDQRRHRRHHRLRRALVVAGEEARMSEFFGSPHALLVLVLAGFLPNEIWRMAGLWFGAGVDEGSEVLIWVRAVATAILAGVIAQILVQPPGALAGVPDWLRYGAVAAGFAVFMQARRSIFAGVVAGEVVLLAGKWWLG